MPAKRPPRKNTSRPQGRQAPPRQGHATGSADFLIVGIGASAGGLESCRKLLNALPANPGMAFVLIQHLDPTHESMLVNLLTGYTAMPVCEAADGMAIESDHLYIIPPGLYLSMTDNVMHLSRPTVRHGARMPFDFLLNSLAASSGRRAVCIVLSGTGTDGSLGLKSVKEGGGLVLTQDPDEAGYNGMPRSAIMTGLVDHILPLAEMPPILLKHSNALQHPTGRTDLAENTAVEDWLPRIVDLLREKTPHDFTLYKPGTLQRRIERRKVMLGISGDMEAYLALLLKEPAELDLLAQDLLINVTRFFRDPEVFEHLATEIIPELVANQPPQQPLRIWVAGCSTGEETYSLTMLFREAIVAAKLNVKLQVFASDIDPDAIAHAREGFFPETISSDVTPPRLTRFFTKVEGGYRVSPELREAVVFTVQDVLTDPPFSRLDMVSCRNLMIYLKPGAQEKVISLFHFALRKDGLLLLGGAETLGNDDSRFAIVSKTIRLYRHVGQHRAGEFGFSMSTGGSFQIPARREFGKAAALPDDLGELCRRLVLEFHAPAAVLIDRNHQCLYSLGPTDRYLRVAPGHPTQDLFAMVRGDLRNRLRSAIQQSRRKNERVVIPGDRNGYGETSAAVCIDVRPVPNEIDGLMLVCFIVQQQDVPARTHPDSRSESPLLAELESELDATRIELEGAIRNLEISSEEQKAINEEALSNNEEFQSANEELVTSQEELQSLNEELTALNSQLQETLEQQRTTSDDLQNVLYSTDIATLFLDTDLNIRFFTPATRSLFGIIATDIGRPISDLSSIVHDSALEDDALSVLHIHEPMEREITSHGNAWFIRRIFPYRTHTGAVGGVVITYSDITEVKHVAEALDAAKRQADLANLAKSRFLAAASHDLRQPLQTLSLLQGILARSIEGDVAQKLLGRMDETLGAMTGMLNALLDINQIEAGATSAEMVDFPVDDLLRRLRDEFDYHARARGLSFRMVPCSLTVHSDPHLLEQILRNLLSNALKYTSSGKLLLGCRRRGSLLSIEVWDTGIGIAPSEHEKIFEEYHQVDNVARERDLGLGLGLTIVRRMADLLDQRLHMQSALGKGSVFAIDVDLSGHIPEALPDRRRSDDDVEPAARTVNKTILIVEDEPDVRQFLELLLISEGYRTITAPTGVAAAALPVLGADRPDLILADFNLPGGMNGLQLSADIRGKLKVEIPVIILTGDISTTTMQEIAQQNCRQLNKPVKVTELSSAIQELLAAGHSQCRPLSVQADDGPNVATVFVIDDDRHVREAIRSVLEEVGRRVEAYSSCEDFLKAYRPGQEACLLVDCRMPGMQGIELLQQLNAAGKPPLTIMITGNGDVSLAVQAMKAGALDFIEKPVTRDVLLASVGRAVALSNDATGLVALQEDAAAKIAGLTQRQRQVMDLVLAGHPNKNIAADLGISQRTVENHRAEAMKKTGSRSLPALARLAVAADKFKADKPSPPRNPPE